MNVAAGTGVGGAPTSHRSDSDPRMTKETKDVLLLGEEESCPRR
jgi:hypothetical protein